MKRITPIAFILFSLTVLISSCTIEKRQHLAGYHIEWKGKGKQEKSISHNEKSDVAEQGNEVFEETITEVNEPVAIESIPSIDQIATDVVRVAEEKSVNSKRAEQIDTPAKKNQSVLRKLNLKESAFEAKRPDMNDAVNSGTSGLAIAGFIFALLGLIILAIPFGLLAVIFCGIALGKISKSESYQSGKGLAIVGLIIGIIDVIVGIYIVTNM